MPDSTPIAGAASDPVTGVADAVASLAGAAQAQIAALAAEAALKNSAAVVANDEASKAAAAHAEFNQYYAAAQKGDAGAIAWIQRALSGAGMAALLLGFLILGSPFLVGCVSTKTIDPTPVGPLAAADFSDDGKPDAGFVTIRADGAAMVTQGLKDNYARLIRKFHDGADPEVGFTKSGTPAPGQPQLYEIRADVAGHYFDLVTAARSGTAPVN
jgi:hypothetical protein